jgi:hypothetical protein
MTLTSLIERVEKCEKPDREIDVAIVQAIFPDIGQYAPHCPGDDPIFWHDPYYKRECPCLTSSIDAVVELMAQVLPGWGWLRKTPGTMSVYHVPSDPKEWAVHIDGVHSVPAIALLLALLKAMEAKEK